MATGQAEDWQVGKSLAECNEYMLENNISDITFRVRHTDDTGWEETVEVTALRLLLLSRSPVFYKMFCGNFAEAPDATPIEVTDVEPAAFKAAVRFMYTDEVWLTADNVLSIKYVAEKYMLATLSQQCSEFLAEVLSAENAPLLLDQSLLYGDAALREKALAVVKEEAAAALASEEFPDMSAAGLREVLQQDLKVNDELLVFQACVQWAEHQCHMQGKSVSGEHLREALGDNLTLIRFPAMSLEAFAQHVTPREVLSSVEENQVFRYLTLRPKKPEHLLFKTEPRFTPTTPNVSSAHPADAVTPRALWLKGVGVRKLRIVRRETSSTLTSSSSFSCNVSAAISLHKIYVHSFSHSAIAHREFTVTLIKNDQVLYKKEVRDPPVIRGSCDTPDHCAVDIPGVHVNAGTLGVQIHCLLTTTVKSFYILIPTAAAEFHLADTHVTITIPRTNPFLLTGIEYLPAM